MVPLTTPVGVVTCEYRPSIIVGSIVLCMVLSPCRAPLSGVGNRNVEPVPGQLASRIAHVARTVGRPPLELE
jgi:hypothetical protein